MPTYTPSSTAILNARLNAANRALARAKQLPKTKGLDAFDKFLINATKLGLCAMFGLYVASKAEQRYQNTLAMQAPIPSNRLRLVP